MEFEIEWKINKLNQQYARCLDEGRLPIRFTPTPTPTRARMGANRI